MSQEWTQTTRNVRLRLDTRMGAELKQEGWGVTPRMEMVKAWRGCLSGLHWRGTKALVTPRACTQESGCNLQIKGPHSRIPVSHPSSPIFTAQLAPSHNALIPQTDSSQLVSGLPYVAITNSPSPRAKLLWALRSSSKAQPQSQVPLFFSQTQGLICSSRGYLLILYHHY
jgi:hypothetical protein